MLRAPSPNREEFYLIRGWVGFRRRSQPKGLPTLELFSKVISPAFAKTQQLRNEGLCIGCGLNPCKCKNKDCSMTAVP